MNYTKAKEILKGIVLADTEDKELAEAIKLACKALEGET